MRRSPDDEIRDQWLDSRTFADTETIINAEVRYERQHTDNLHFAASWFVYSLDLVAYTSSTNRTEGLGKQNAWGFELEGSYVTDKTQFNFSHGYTKLGVGSKFCLTVPRKLIKKESNQKILNPEEP